MYVIGRAINAMIKSGGDPIAGRTSLLDYMKGVSFTGASGRVAFQNDTGDRVAAYKLMKYGFI